MATVKVELNNVSGKIKKTVKKKLRIVALLMCTVLLGSFISCAGFHKHDFSEKVTTAEYFAKDATQTTATEFYYRCKKCGVKSKNTFEYGKKDSERAAVGSNAKSALDGKKILIAGCSYNYYGRIVVPARNDIKDEASRVNDTGYFYELCKQNGAEVSVTNWCFGNHGLDDFFGTSCAAGECGNGFNHLNELKDRDYDYVSLMDIGRPNKPSLEEYMEELKGYMKLFTDVNPDCKFIYSIPCGAYWYKHTDRTNFKDIYFETVYAKEIAKLDNVIVMDWGRMIYDLIKGDASVPGSSFAYNENSLIVADGYHPNLLSGYINTLMTYCVITGETAVGQPINLEGMLAEVTMSNFIKNYYRNETTNFAEIMGSESEMEGIQRLINRYIDMNTYLYY
ncbi:MAG: SGNH/GDSL hydrolase family protein [Clostridia bacterium]|nr:SGNH/GDSL hydrolase family protein [Clostridia bacterium]